MTQRLPSHLDDVSAFQAVEVFQAAGELERAGKSVIHLEFGEPDFPTPKVITEAGIAALRAGQTHYTHSLGIPEFRAAIAAYHEQKYGNRIDPAQVVVSNGTSVLMQMLMLMLLEPGDEIIVSDPTYACYENFVRLARGVPVRVPIHESEAFQLNPDAVRAAITPRTRGIMICSPANPTGVVMRPEVLAALADLGLPVISDEIYHGLSYAAPDHSILSHGDGHFVLNGFSKYFAMTGWRLGYMISPRETMGTVMKLHQNIMISATDFAQHAGLAALTKAIPVCERYRAEYDRRRLFLVERLGRMGLPLGYEPAGAFYVFVNMKRYTEDSLAFAMEILREAGVALTPGVDFGPGGEGYLRISYANSLERIAQAMDQLEAFLVTR